MKVNTTGRILFHSLFRRWKMIAGLGLSIMGTILIGSLLWSPSYIALCSVIIQGRNYENLLLPELRQGGQATVFVNRKEEINSEIEIIRSRPVLERVVESLRLHARKDARDEGLGEFVRRAIRSALKPARNLLIRKGLARERSEQDAFEAAVIRLSQRLKVEPATDSQIVRIIYRDPDPVMASQVVNKVAEEYLDQHLTINLKRAEGSFYAEQIKTVQGELTALQDQLEKMKNREGIISFSEQSRALLKKLEGFDVARATVQKEIISKRSKVEKIRELLRSNPDLLIPLPEIAKDPQIEDLENELVNLRFQLEALRKRYTEGSRQVVTAREQVAETRAQIRDQVSRFLDREMAELRKLEAEEQALTQTINALNADIRRLPATELALSNLEKQIEVKQAGLTVLWKRHQDSSVAQATDFRLENVKIVSRASIPLRPATPNLPLNMSLGLILALVVGFSAAFFVEYWDDSLKVPEDVERYLGLQVFASIPEL